MDRNAAAVALPNRFDNRPRINPLVDVKRDGRNLEGSPFRFSCPDQLRIEMRVISTGFLLRLLILSGVTSPTGKTTGVRHDNLDNHSWSSLRSFFWAPTESYPAIGPQAISCPNQCQSSITVKSAPDSEVGVAYPNPGCQMDSSALISERKRQPGTGRKIDETAKTWRIHCYGP